MTSLMDKARVAVLGKMHSLLDQVANTPDAYKQRIRDLESALADLRAAGDEAQGTANGHKRRVVELQGSIASKQGDIDLLLGDNDPSNDEAALTLQTELLELTDQIATEQSLQQQAESNQAQLQDAIDKLEGKHREMVNSLSKLTIMAAATKAQNRASAAAESAASAASAASSVDIDNIEAKLTHENDVASARFDRVIGGLTSASSSPEEAARLARAKAALEARRATITAAAQQSPAPATAGA